MFYCFFFLQVHECLSTGLITQGAHAATEKKSESAEGRNYTPTPREHARKHAHSAPLTDTHATTTASSSRRQTQPDHHHPQKSDNGSRITASAGIDTLNTAPGTAAAACCTPPGLPLAPPHRPFSGSGDGSQISGTA